MKKIRLSDFDYHLPLARIAQKPVRPRDASRLMIANTGSKTLAHRRFRDIGEYLREGDVLVVNDSKVIPARLMGTKDTGGAVEVLLVRKRSAHEWSALIKNFKESEIGKAVTIGKRLPLHCTPKEKRPDGTWYVSFKESGEAFEQRLALHGKTPTPPYIPSSSVLSVYQTIYAKRAGSVAAPTAGFHFTKLLLRRLKKRGITVCIVTLHVGPGTFLPIREEDITRHVMHNEHATVSAKTASTINAAKKSGRRIIAVGTTSVRTLESFTDEDGYLRSGERDVNLFIYPGFRFKTVDALITNFHLPKSTLLLLVSAFAEHKTKNGAARIRQCYTEAIKKKYRFYSFGDAMMIL